MADKAVVGIMRIARGPQPDPKAPEWVSVRVEPVRKLERPVTLAAIKAEPAAREDGADPPVAAVGRAGASRKNGT